MSSWSVRRRLIYLLIVFLFFAVIFYSIYWIFLWHPASCSDNIQNQGELGVDCGGPCSRVCAVEVSPLIKDWARTFKVEGGKYDVAALIENPNFNLGLKKLDYKFTLFDSENVPITDKSGSVFVNARDKFVIFETGLDTGKRIPLKAIVEFSQDLTWTRVDPKANKPPIIVQNQVLTNGQMPRLVAELINDSVFDLSDIIITAVIYDSDNNAVAVSQTFVNGIQKGRSSDIFFTWPNPFLGDHQTFEIYPRVNLVR
ncbi:MAG: hypothetical protein HY225_03360 [Candidatus Vogelbacteria bacterium]|nr:hypothetical protein [Candidatus Vogelbacteria bacterium]